MSNHSYTYRPEPQQTKITIAGKAIVAVVLFAGLLASALQYFDVLVK